jgi:hypothetical protein
MSKYQFALLAGAAALTAAVLATPALTQHRHQPPFATTKVDGTDGVYHHPQWRRTVDVHRHAGRRHRH